MREPRLPKLLIETSKNIDRRYTLLPQVRRIIFATALICDRQLLHRTVDGSDYADTHTNQWSKTGNGDCSFLLCLSPVSAANVNSAAQTDDTIYLEKALTAYDHLNNAAAISYGQKYLKNHHTDAMAHYCLGNAFSRLGRKDDALGEYTAALRFSNSNSITRYCNQAIAAWLKPNTQTLATGEPQNIALNKSANKRSDTGDVKLDRVIDNIQDQAQALDSNHFNGRGATELQRKQFGEQVQALQNVIYNSRKNPDNGFAPNIDLLGTDLFVRHYATPFSHSKPVPEPPELVATPERLVLDFHSRPGKTISRVVRDLNPENNPEANIDLKVRGRVMVQSHHI